MAEQSIEKTTEEASQPKGVMRCLRCKGRLEQGGKEPHRFICEDCGQNYFAVMQLVPVDAKKESRWLDAGERTRSE